MTLEEFLEIINALPYVADRAAYAKKYLKAAKEAGFETPADFILSLIQDARFKVKSELDATIAYVTNEEGDYPIGPRLKEIWLSGYKFEDCDEPEMLLSFCDPLGGNWNKRLKDLNEKQLNTFNLIDMKYRKWKKRMGVK